MINEKNGEMKQGCCRLCGKNAMLADSHIFPKLVIKPLKEERGHMLAINGLGKYGVKKLQDGEKEALLCLDCEGMCSRLYERPFAEAWASLVPKAPWAWGQKLVRKVPYSTFKLFHLLNLFRASVSGSTTFGDVSLGPHEATIREMLMSQDPGPPDRYAIAGTVIYSSTDGQLIEALVPPRRLRYEGHSAYKFIYLGVEWTVLVSDGGWQGFRKNTLKEDGTLTLVGWPWQQHEVVKSAAVALAGKQPWL